MRRRAPKIRVEIALLLCLATSCTSVISVDAGLDAGDGRDAAVAQVDAGDTTGDGGIDASASTDAGAPEVDSGSPADAGATSDAGAPEPPGWLRGFGAGGDDGAQSVASTPDRIYVGGHADGRVVFGVSPTGETIQADFARDGFVAAYDHAGRPLWVRRYGGPGPDRVMSVAVDRAGNVYFAGNWQSTADLGDGVARTAAGIQDMFVSSLRPDGSLRWPEVVTFGSSAPMGSGDELSAIAIDDSRGQVVITGSVGGPTDFGGGVRGFLAVDDRGDPGYDAFLLGCALTDGAYRWDRTLRSRFFSQGADIAIHDGTGDVVVVGFGGGDAEPVAGMTRALGPVGDAFVIRYTFDASSLRWVHSFGHPMGYTMASSVTIASSGIVYVGGYGSVDWSLGAFDFSSAGGWDGFLLSFAADASGGLRWGLPLRAAADDFVSRIRIADADELVVTGAFSDGARFGYATSGEVLLPATRGGRDVFLARLTDFGSGAAVLTPIPTLGTSGHDSAPGLTIAEGRPVVVGTVGGPGATAAGETLGFAGGSSDGFVWRHRMD